MNHLGSGEDTNAGDGSQLPAAMGSTSGGSNAVSSFLTYVLGASSGPPELPSWVPLVSPKVVASGSSGTDPPVWPSQQGDCIVCLVRLRSVVKRFNRTYLSGPVICCRATAAVAG
jgi:hypothetical protein